MEQRQLTGPVTGQPGRISESALERWIALVLALGGSARKWRRCGKDGRPGVGRTWAGGLAFRREFGLLIRWFQSVPRLIGDHEGSPLPLVLMEDAVDRPGTLHVPPLVLLPGLGPPGTRELGPGLEYLRPRSATPNGRQTVVESGPPAPCHLGTGSRMKVQLTTCVYWGVG